MDCYCYVEGFKIGNGFVVYGYDDCCSSTDLFNLCILLGLMLVEVLLESWYLVLWSWSHSSSSYFCP